MSYSKTILCLACSYMGKGGYCIAGKELMEDGSLGDWIRPVSTKKWHLINKCKFKHLPKSNGEPNLLVKYLKIPIHNYVPHGHQIENYQIDSRKELELLDSFSEQYKQSLGKTIDKPENLWIMNSSESDNDKVPKESMEKIDSSLLLIKVKKQIKLFGERACFIYNDDNYRLKITDIQLRDNFKNNDMLPENTLLCVSLPSVIKEKGYAYKLVAGVITPKMYENILL